MSALPLRGPHFRRAARIQKHLLSLRAGSAERVHEIADDLGDLLRSDDVSVALNDPSPGAGALSLWFRDFPAEKLRGIATATGGHKPFQFVRSTGLRTVTFDQGDQLTRGAIRETEFFRKFERESNLYHGLITHLGTEAGESLGRIVFYRDRAGGDFDGDRIRLLEIMRPALSHAARVVMSAQLDEGDEEAALVNAGGQVLWMSDGFRFLWNAVDPVRMECRRLSVADTLQGSDLGRAVALRIIMLDGRPTEFRPPRNLVVPFRSGADGFLVARFDVVSDHLLGCRGDVLRVSLRRLAAEAVSVEPQRPD